MTLQSFINRPKVSITAKWVDSNPNMADQGWRADHYKVTLRRAGRTLTTYFSMGLALSRKPSAEDVLDCLASDSAGIENAGSFEDWCSEYGYDIDSRKAEKIFKVCERQAEKLKQFLGDDAYSTLLWKCDHL